MSYKAKPLTEEQRQLAAENVGLAYTAAGRHHVVRLGLMDYDTAVSVGLITLCRAARTYDPTRKIKFSTYATTSALMCIARAQRAEAESVIGQSVGLFLDDDDRPGSGQPLADDPEPLDQLIAEEDNSGPGVAAAELLARLCDTLTPLESEALRHRFGLDGVPECTLKGIGQKIGRSTEGGRQALERAVKKIRQRAAELGLMTAGA